LLNKSYTYRNRHHLMEVIRSRGISCPAKERGRVQPQLLN
jgi:hypothetical protein